MFSCVRVRVASGIRAVPQESRACRLAPAPSSAARWRRSRRWTTAAGLRGHLLGVVERSTGLQQMADVAIVFSDSTRLYWVSMDAEKVKCVARLPPGVEYTRHQGFAGFRGD